MNSIEIQNLTKTYSDFTLNNISFTLPSGAIMGLVGENGAGKSTTIQLIMDAIKADSGTVTVLGTANTSPQFTQVKQDIGVVLDEAYFPEVLNAKDIGNIMKHSYQNWSDAIYQGYLQKFSLPIKKQFKDYSRGMKMKLAISVALSHSPKLLILDEATSGLDPMIRDEILDVFNEFTRDETHAVLISSHIISDLEKICDYIVFLHKGNLVLNEEKDLLLQRYGVLKLSSEEADALPEDAIVLKQKKSFGYQVLVYKDKVHPSFKFEYITLEDIVLLMAKGDIK